MLAGADGSWVSLLPAQLPAKDGATRASKPHPFHDKMQVKQRVATIFCLEI